MNVYAWHHSLVLCFVFTLPKNTNTSPTHICYRSKTLTENSPFSSTGEKKRGKERQKKRHRQASVKS